MVVVVSAVESVGSSVVSVGSCVGRVGGKGPERGCGGAGQQRAELASRRALHAFGRRVGEAERLGEVVDLRLVVEQPTVGQPQDPCRSGAGRDRRLDGGGDDVLVGPAGGEGQHGDVGQLAFDELADTGPEIGVHLVELVEPVLELGVLVLEGPVVVLDAVEVALELVDRRPVDEGGAEGEADAEGQEDGGDRHDVVAEVDHVSSTHSDRSSRRIGSLMMTKTTNTRVAAATISSRSRARTWFW